MRSPVACFGDDDGEARRDPLGIGERRKGVPLDQRAVGDADCDGATRARGGEVREVQPDCVVAEELGGDADFAKTKPGGGDG